MAGNLKDARMLFKLTDVRFIDLKDELIAAAADEEIGGEDQIDKGGFVTCATEHLMDEATPEEQVRAKEILEGVFDFFLEFGQKARAAQASTTVAVENIAIGFQCIRLHGDTEETCRAIFELYDHDGSGTIEAAELHEFEEQSAVFSNACLPVAERKSVDDIEELAEHAVEAMLKRFGEDAETGKLDYEQFKKVYTEMMADQIAAEIKSSAVPSAPAAEAPAADYDARPTTPPLPSAPAAEAPAAEAPAAEAPAAEAPAAEAPVQQSVLETMLAGDPIAAAFLGSSSDAVDADAAAPSATTAVPPGPTLNFAEAREIFALDLAKFTSMYERMLHATHESEDKIEEQQFVDIAMDTLELRAHDRAVDCQRSLVLIFKEHLALDAQATGANPTRVVFEGLIIGFQIFFSQAEASLASNFLFKLYDFNHDGTIARDEVFEFIEHAKTSHIALLNEDEQAGRRESVKADTKRDTDKFMLEADTDRDGSVTRAEFDAWYKRTIRHTAASEAAAPQIPAQGAARTRKDFFATSKERLRDALAQGFENREAAEAFPQNSRMAMLRIRRLFALRSDDLSLFLEALKHAAGARQVLTRHSFLAAASSSLSAVFDEVVAVEEKGEMHKALVSIFAAFLPHDSAVDFISYFPVYLAVAELVSTRDRKKASKFVFDTLTAASRHSVFADEGSSLTSSEMINYLKIVLTAHNGLLRSEAKVSAMDISLLAKREVEQLFVHLELEVGEEPLYQRALFDEWFTTRVTPVSYDTISESAIAIHKLSAMHAEITARESSIAAREEELEKKLLKMKQREHDLQLLEIGGMRKAARRDTSPRRGTSQAVPLRSGATIPLLPALRALLRLNPGEFSLTASALEYSMQTGYIQEAGIPRSMFVQACMRSSAKQCPSADQWVNALYDIFLDQTPGGNGQASLLELTAAVALISHPSDEQQMCRTLFDLASPAQGSLAIGEFLEAAMPLAIIDWNATGRLALAKASGDNSSTIISTIVQEVVMDMRALKLGDGWTPSQPIDRTRFAAWFHAVLEAAIGGNRFAVAKKYPSTASKLSNHTGRFQKVWTCCSCANRYSRACCTPQDPTYIANWEREHTYDAVRSEWHAISTAPLPMEAYPVSETPPPGRSKPRTPTHSLDTGGPWPASDSSPLSENSGPPG